MPLVVLDAHFDLLLFALSEHRCLSFSRPITYSPLRRSERVFFNDLKILFIFDLLFIDDEALEFKSLLWFF